MSELGDFLRTRRARLNPEEVGLTSYGARRRVPGLRREELAQLAGVSVAYYTRLEQGQSRNASDSVLDAVARALRLDDDERAHLLHLARPVKKRRPPVARPETARTATRQLIEALDGVPAAVLDRRTNVLAWNRFGHALLAGHLAFDDRPNLARLLFLDPHTRELYPRWDEEARVAIASLRMVAGENPEDRALAELIGELSMKSGEFTSLWARHPVRTCTFGVKLLHHPLVGELELNFENMVLPDDSGQRVLMYSAAPGSPARGGLDLLRELTAPPARLSERQAADGG
ncbi:helix-turn-helix transcriptional regulator [Phytomonospora endophytica]|uniref:Transcriptional regulator with XRE-family HTH domain n=1 Tax=Phytomonospora endophytica TaxID=714109 RepID=A0A841FTI5_9ACTN|nr:helix-turn-helix transcriptional regulator [Phytomonospora endophytica]MBB6037048.1 transcriptional regulator with XRE-family HTH domain [Phytomonospora endophytica]GIG69408.1 transcriptional regulator [Phytomonospora endophytica]